MKPSKNGDESADSSGLTLPIIDLDPESPLPVGNISQESALRVAKGSIGFASVAFVAGTINGALRAQPAVLYGMNSGISTFAFAFPILALREYAVAPSIESYMRTNFPDHQPSLHTHNLLASTVSGAVAGGAMSAYFRGRQKLLAGARTWAVLAFGLQIVGNEVRVLRINTLSQSGVSVTDSQTGRTLNTQDGSMQRLRNAWNEPIKPERTHDLAAGVASKEVAANVHQPMAKKDATLREPKPTSSSQANGNQDTWVGRMWAKTSSLIPVKRISDDEYEQRLLQERQVIVDRIRQLDQHIAIDEDAARKV